MDLTLRGRWTSLAMMSAKMWLVLGVVLLSVLFLAGCKLTRAGYESAGYKVVRRSGAFEIRDYPALTLVSTPMTATHPTDDDSFMRLFRYIGGANETEAKIASKREAFSWKLLLAEEYERLELYRRPRWPFSFCRTLRTLP